MVVICQEPYKWNHINSLKKEFPFELDHFQKYAIEAIDNGNHILVTAHTGSGKTLPAEYAIEKFCKEGKKVIYTSPIKSLSNQKYHEFTKKFPDISIGILTGDIKFNPEADCIIMTTEILRNKLFQKEKDHNQLDFNIDMETELACVIFDEVHYINDAERGKVWEECMIQLPKHIQMVMLSATIDKPEEFAKWIEENGTKEVWVASTYRRNVPLTHYCFVPLPSSSFKQINKHSIDLVTHYTNEPIIIKSNVDGFNSNNYKQLDKVFNVFTKDNIHINNTFALNSITGYLKSHNQMPAICFVFNRRFVESYAQKISINLFTDKEAKLSAKAKQECIKILMKLPNYKEYMELPEFDLIVKLIEKGVAIHHAGLLPIFREMIELMFSKGYVKMLFATETFAVGINLPTKSVIFSNIEKWDGHNTRYLFPHEYTQMAGRAGRRGLDKFGNVYHLNSNFKWPAYAFYKDIFSNQAQALISKFQIYPQLVLRILYENISIDEFATRSMLNLLYTKQVQNFEEELEELEQDYKEETELHNEYKIIHEYKQILDRLHKQEYKKQKKQLQQRKSTIESTCKDIYKDLIIVQQKEDTRDKIKNISENINDIKTYTHSCVDDIKDFLIEDKYIDDNDKLTEMGMLAMQLQEVHGLSFSYFLLHNDLNKLTSKEMSIVLSSLANVTVTEQYYSLKELGQFNKNVNIELVKEFVRTYQNDYVYVTDFEETKQIYSKSTYNVQYDFMEFIDKWYEVSDESGAKKVIQDFTENTSTFIGEIIKGILKINAIVLELINIYNKTDDNTELVYKLENIVPHIMKFVVSNESLYI